MSNFAFIQSERPNLNDAVSKAEALAFPVAWTAAAELDALFATLQHRAFRGERRENRGASRAAILETSWK